MNLHLLGDMCLSENGRFSLLRKSKKKLRGMATPMDHDDDDDDDDDDDEDTISWIDKEWVLGRGQHSNTGEGDAGNRESD